MPAHQEHRPGRAPRERRRSRTRGFFLERLEARTLLAGPDAASSMPLRLVLAGDLDGDARVTLSDVRRVQRGLGSVAGDQGYTAEADLDADGRVDRSDVRLARRLIRTSMATGAAYHVPGESASPVVLTAGLAAVEADYRNEVGVFLVDGPGGRIGSLLPGDPGYARVALSPDRRRRLFGADDPAGSVARVEVGGGAYFGVYAIPNATADQVLARNPLNRRPRGPIAYFSFPSANPDRYAHFISSESGEVGVEDRWRGGDRDHDDAVLRFSVSTPTVGAPGSGDPTGPAPGSPDAVAPTLRLTSVPPASPTRSNVVVAGVATDDRPGPVAVRVQVDGGPFLDLPLDAAGTFAYRTTLPLDGTADGPHTIRIVALDPAGNVTEARVSFVLDTRPPSLAFGLDPAWDTAPVGDGATEFGAVDLVGRTEPGLVVAVAALGLSTTADSDGFFRFRSVPLPTLGLHSWTASTRDAAGNESSAQAAVARVAPATNLAPTFATTPVAAVEQGRPYGYAARADDPDGDPLRYRLLAAPEGMEVDEETGAVAWAPTAGDLRMHLVVLRVEDGRGGVDQQRFDVAVGERSSNRPPSFESDPIVAAAASSPYAYGPVVRDPDGDALEFALEAAPPGMTIDAAGGAIAWAPEVSAIGVHTVTVVASDSRGGVARQSYVVVVAPPPDNHAPAIVSRPITRHALSQGEYSYDVEAVDADGDALTFSLAASPAGMAIDAATGEIRWSPPAGEVGSHAVSIRVEDGRGGSDEAAFTLEIVAAGAGSVSGVVWDDRNANGVRDTNIVVGDAPTVLFVVDVSGSMDDPFRGTPVGNLDGDRLSDTRLDAAAAGVLALAGRLGELGFGGAAKIGLIRFNGSAASVDMDPSLAGSQLVGLLGDDRDGDGRDDLAQALRSLTPQGGTNFQAGLRAAVGVFQQLGTPPGQGNIVFLTDAAGSSNYAQEAATLAEMGVNIQAFGVGEDASLDDLFAMDPTPRRFTSTDELLAFFEAGDGAGVEYLEPALEGWRVYIDANANGRRDAGEPSAAADVLGRYTLAGLPPGDFSVLLEAPAGWNRTLPPSGGYRVTLGADQALSGKDFGAVQIAPRAPNRDPFFTSQAPAAVVAGQAWRYDAAARDFDGDPLAFDLPAAPDGMAVHAGLGALVWRPTAGQVGVHTVVVRVRDGRGGVAVQSFEIVVDPPNAAPQVTAAPSGTLFVGREFRSEVRASDPEGGPLAYRLASGPEGLGVDPATGRVSWTPDADQVGVHEIVVAVSDEAGATTLQSFRLEVAAGGANGAPDFVSSPRGRARLGQAYFYRVEAEDPDGDPLSYRLAVAPAGMTIDGEGLLRWEPSPEQFGANAVEIVADDGKGGLESQRFLVEVVAAAANVAPRVAFTPLEAAVAGRAFADRAGAVDDDGDAVAWSLDLAPRGMSIDPLTGAIAWTPEVDQVGVHSVVVRARDAIGAAATLAYAVTVRPTGLPPRFTSVPVVAASVGREYFYAAAAVDPEGGPTTYSLASAPDGMQVDAATGRIRWVPASAGTFAVAVRVQDRDGSSAVQEFSLVVAADAPNAPPIVTSNPPLVATPGRGYRYRIVAVDPEGGPVAPVLLEGPDGMALDPATGELTWTPTAAQVGVRVVSLAVFDAAGAGGMQRFFVAVGVNAPPTVVAPDADATTVGAAYRRRVVASDPEQGPLAYVLAEGPAGMTIDRNGFLAWLPAQGDWGAHVVRVRVVDEHDAVAEAAFVLTAAADDAGPTVELALSNSVLDVGRSVRIQARAVDDVGVASLVVLVDGRPVALQGDLEADGVLSAEIVLERAGLIDVVATARDAAGNEGVVARQVRAVDPDASGAPAVSILSPAQDATVTHQADVVGSVAGDGLEYWRVDYARYDLVDLDRFADDDPDFRTLAEGTAAVRDAVLARFDATLLANDAYVIRLYARDASGRVNTTGVVVGVAGEAKLGNFTLSFTDLSIPLAGVPIEIVRSYDTLDAGRSGDFGYGWSLGVGDADIRETVPDTSGVYSDAAFRLGTRVYLNAPDGRRVGFTFDPVPKASFFGTLWAPRFTPDPGVNYTLADPALDDYALQQRPDGRFGGFLGLFDYNPDAYELTTPEGLTYRFDQAEGLRSIVDRNGARVTVARDAITHSSGVSIAIRRDESGRIREIVDPAGNRYSYSYDAAGDLVAFVDAAGARTTYAYRPEPAHFLRTVVDPKGVTTLSAEFDAAGRLIGVADAAGGVARQSLDPGGFAGRVVDALGNVTLLTYDARGNVLTRTDPAGAVTRYEYGDPANPDKETRVVDPLGFATVYTYDAAGNVTSVADALGGVRRATYNAFDKPVVETDPLGRVATSLYDAKGNLTTFVNAAGDVSTLAYDAAGRVTASTDNEGRATTYEYAGGSRPSRVVFPDGSSRSFAYNGLGLPTLIVDERGGRFELSYDALGRLLAVRDPLGGVTSYAYDVASNLVRSSDPLGRTTTYEYDAKNRRVRTLDPLGGATTYAYDLADRLVATTDALGRTTTYRYRADGRLEAVVDALGGVTTYEYDAAGNRVAEVDALGRRRTYDFDALGRLVAQHDCLCATEYLAYDAVGNLASRTDRNGAVTTFAYDVLNRLTAMTDALGGVTSRAYDPDGDLVAVTDAAGRTTRYEYDARGRLAREIDPLGFASTYAYDAAGNQASYTDALGHTTSFTYDALGRLLTTVDAAGGVATNAYDLAGNLVAATDALGRTTAYAYDGLDRLVSETDPLGGVVRYGYDAVGDRTSLTDPLGNRTVFAYDALGRLTSEVDPLGAASTYAYDAVGNRIVAVDRNGRRRTFAYDILDRPTEEKWWDGEELVRTIRTDYDDAGNVVARSDAESVYSYAYDALGRLITVDNAGTPGAPRVVLTGEYDAVGNRVNVRDDTGIVVGSSYDARDQLISRTWQGGGVAPIRVDFAYDARGGRTGVLRFADLAGSARVGSSTIAYDALGRTSRITHLDALDAVLADYAYAYDLAGRLAEEIRNGERIVYANDAAGQLTGVDRNVGADQGYAYDANGNRTGGGYVVGPGNRLLSDGRFAYAYDAEGNVIRKTEAATGVVVAYAYDHRNRLTSAVERDAAGAIRHQSTYTYDVEDRLIARSVDGRVLRTVYDGLDAWADFDAGGLVVARYLHGDAVDEILARHRPADGMAWYLADKLGSIRDVADAAGAALDRRDYDAFGNIQFQTNSAAGDRFAFTGREYDAATGLYYYRARFYEPATGRFLSEDPIGFSAGDANLARYVGNGPANATDPFGMVAAMEYVKVASIGFVVGAGLSLITCGDGGAITVASRGFELEFSNGVAGGLLGAAAALALASPLAPVAAGAAVVSAGIGIGVIAAEAYSDYESNVPVATIALETACNVLVGVIPGLVSGRLVSRPVWARASKSVGLTVHGPRAKFSENEAQVRHIVSAPPTPTSPRGWGDIGSHGPVSPDIALGAAQKWLGTGYREIAPGIFRSADRLRQFRMTTSDLMPKGTHARIGPHVHFEALDGAGKVIENLHLPVLP